MLIRHPELHSSYPDYLWYPGVLANASHSAERMHALYQHQLASKPTDVRSDLIDLLASGLGIHDASDAELDLLMSEPGVSFYTFADMVSRRAQTGWSTHGHSAADVNIYTSDRKVAAALTGNHENTEVGKFLRDYLDVDVDAVTKELKRKGTQFDALDAEGKKVSWMGRLPEEGERLDGQDHMDHYQGDFKKHKRGCDICGGHM